MTDTWFDKRQNIYRPYPHLIIRKITPESSLEPIWECDYCHARGTLETLEIISCTERPAPCKWCGESPLCAPDCVGVALVLSDPKIHLA